MFLVSVAIVRGHLVALLKSLQYPPPICFCVFENPGNDSSVPNCFRPTVIFGLLLAPELAFSLVIISQYTKEPDRNVKSQVFNASFSMDGHKVYRRQLQRMPFV